MSSPDLNHAERAADGVHGLPAALEQLRTKPHAFTLFAALRMIEQSHPQQPRLGESRKASDDVVRLGQVPHLSFAPSDVATATTDDDGRLSLEQYGFGVFGPNGALPLHLTELAYERRRHKEDGTLVDFLNLFQHRLISLFYRVWADSEPTVNLDRPESDRFRGYVGALLGIGPKSARDADAVPDYAKLSRAGLFAQQSRSAEGLEAILSDYFEIPIEVRSFAGAWLDIPGALHCRLGEQQLGLSTTLGASTWQCQHKFEIVLGPLTSRNFADFLPGARGLTELHALVRLYTGDEWSWQARLILRDVDIPGASLGGRAPRSGTLTGNQLGWTSWLGARRAGAEDVVIQDTRAAASSTGAASNGAGTAGNDTGTAGNDTGTAGNDSGTAGNDTGAAVNDAGEARHDTRAALNASARPMASGPSNSKPFGARAHG